MRRLQERVGDRYTVLLKTHRTGFNFAFRNRHSGRRTRSLSSDRPGGMNATGKHRLRRRGNRSEAETVTGGRRHLHGALNETSALHEQFDDHNTRAVRRARAALFAAGHGTPEGLHRDEGDA